MADLLKNGHLPAEAFRLVYLKMTRIPGGWRRHPDYEIFYHMNGPIAFEVEGELYPLQPGDFLLLPPGVEHRATGPQMPEGTPYEGALMRLEPELIDYIEPLFDDGKKISDCFAKRKTGYLLRLPRNQRRINGGMMKRLYDALKMPEQYGHAVNIVSLLALFLVNLYNNDAEFRNQRSASDRNLAENVREYIDRYYASPLNLDQLAELFFVSKYHLMHDFSHSTGISVYRYIMQRRLQAVCELLEKDVPPSEAYQQCGFRDYANFYRAFRSALGQSPREYAQTHRKDTVTENNL